MANKTLWDVTLTRLVFKERIRISEDGSTRQVLSIVYDLVQRIYIKCGPALSIIFPGRGWNLR